MNEAENRVQNLRVRVDRIDFLAKTMIWELLPILNQRHGLLVEVEKKLKGNPISAIKSIEKNIDTLLKQNAKLRGVLGCEK